MPKKLTDFDPHWIQPPGWTTDKFYTGVSFLCPHCVHTPCPTCGAPRGKRLAVNFYPPIDPKGWLSKINSPESFQKGHKRVRGETFDTLTLEPSVGFDNIGHWHGHIIDGIVTPAGDSRSDDHG